MRQKCVGYEKKYDCENLALRGANLCSFCKGRRFEIAVRAACEDLGGKVTPNINVDGSQCDLIVEFEEKFGRISCLVECKAEANSVGVTTVTQFFNTFQAASRTRQLDKAMLVSEVGFTADGRTKAESLGILCYTLTELRDRRANFAPYLLAIVAEYEDTTFFKRKHYIQLEIQRDKLLDDELESFVNVDTTGPLLLIMGDFGAGKTTTLRRFLWKQAKRYMAKEEEVRIPLFVNLRDFHTTMDLNKTLVGMLIDEYGLNLDGLRTFRQFNREGKLVLLLDGFDEMIAKAGPEYLIPAFKEFEKVVSPLAKVVISIRTHFLRDSAQIGTLAGATALQEYASEKGYPVFYIQPLTSEKVYEYIDQVAPHLKDAFLRTDQLKQLASRPILLNMIVDTLPALLRLERPPRTGDLYKVYTDQWLGRDDWRCKMDHVSRHIFSENLAYHFYLGNKTTIHYSDLPPIISKEFPDIQKFRDLEYFDMDVRTSTFLSRDATGNYSFSHKSFYEFFVASKVVSAAAAGVPLRKNQRYSAEILDFVSDLVRTSIGQWSAMQTEQVLNAMYDVFAGSNSDIVKYRQGPTDSEGRPYLHERTDLESVSEAQAENEARQIIKHLTNLYIEERPSEGPLLVVHEYSPRKFLGDVEFASNMSSWRRNLMCPLDGKRTIFFRLSLVTGSRYEYKYIEDQRWEPFDNRVLNVTEVIMQVTDHHRGERVGPHVW